MSFLKDVDVVEGSFSAARTVTSHEKTDQAAYVGGVCKVRDYQLLVHIETKLRASSHNQECVGVAVAAENGIRRRPVDQG